MVNLLPSRFFFIFKFGQVFRGVFRGGGGQKAMPSPQKSKFYLKYRSKAEKNDDGRISKHASACIKGVRMVNVMEECDVMLKFG